MTEHAETMSSRLKTGIPGLDLVLEGGLLRGGVYIAEGPPGAGKTVLAAELCFNGARAGEQALFVTLLAESNDRMMSHLSRMKFFDAALVPERVYFVSAFRDLQRDGLPALLRLLRETIMQREASILVLDGIVTAEEISLSRAAAASATAQDASSSQQFKQFIHELQSVSTMTGCTVLLLSSTERPRAFHPAYTMVDGILELTNDLSGLKTIRHLHVRKMRGTDQVVGKHNFEISERGFVLHPRIETRLYTPREAESEVADAGTRLPFGIDTLDRMLGGGLPANTVTMLLGPTGSGKTLLSAQFITEGARLGEPGVYFGFYERPSALFLKCERIGLDLRGAVDRGLVEIVWQPPVETVIDALAERLFTAIRRTGAKRVVIDSIQCFQLSLDDYPQRIRGVFSAIAEELERLGVTSMYTIETRDLFGSQVEIPVTGISAATQNIILLRHVEQQSQLRILLTALKVRDSTHDRTIRELSIDERGLHVVDIGTSDEQRVTASTYDPVRSRTGERKARKTGRAPHRTTKRKR